MALDDAHARLLAKVLDRIQGENDPGPRAQLLWKVLAALSQDDVLPLRPDTSAGLAQGGKLGQQDLVTQLYVREESRAARLTRLQFQLTAEQLAVVRKALDTLLPQARVSKDGNPNLRGTALYLLCKRYLELVGRP